MKDETVNRALDLVEKTGTSIHDAIGQLAASMGVAAEHVYGVLVRQQIISGWVTLGACAAGFVVLIALAWVVVALGKKGAEFDAGERRYSENPYSTPWAMTCVVTIIYAVMYVPFAVAYGTDAVKMLLNPEYYAIREAAEFAGRILGN